MNGGLTAGIVQDDRSGRVLMLGYLNDEALRLTAETGEVHFYSRSRGQLWRKGATSGNTLRVVSVTPDCDGDALLIRAIPAGPTCHTGAESCFGDAVAGTLPRLWATIAQRKADRPPGSYTVDLLEAGPEAIGRKVVEEAVETLLAARDAAAGGPVARVAEEASDLLYHLLVLLAERDLDLTVVLDVLERRAG